MTDVLYTGVMAETSTAEWVSAAAVRKVTGCPIEVIYRLAEAGTIPFQDQTAPWTKKRRYLFTVASVQAALKKMEQARRAS